MMKKRTSCMIGHQREAVFIRKSGQEGYDILLFSGIKDNDVTRPVIYLYVLNAVCGAQGIFQNISLYAHAV